MRFGYMCFGCDKPVDKPLENKYWCEKCRSHGYYQGKLDELKRVNDVSN